MMTHLRALALVALAGCGGTTGGGLVTFHAAASGPPDATGGALTFTSNEGFQVALSKATLHLGAIYLYNGNPTSGAQDTACVLPDTTSNNAYVGEVFGPLDVDLLSPQPQPFPNDGIGTATHANIGEVWLNRGSIDSTNTTSRIDEEQGKLILDVAGTASRGGGSYPFAGKVTIEADNRLSKPNPIQPGAKPICKQRIVTGVIVDVTPHSGGTLVLQIDPRDAFNNIDFTIDGGATFVIPDANTGAGQALFSGITARSGVYDFEWQD